MRDVLSGLRPRYVIVENSAALLGHRDVFGQLLGDLAELGFDAEWSVLTACALGAPHVRRRLFIVAYPHSGDGPERLGTGRGWPVQALDGGTGPWLHPVDGLLAAERRSRRMADGVPDRMEPARVRALGNAVVPQVAEFLGRIILQEETLSRTGPVPI
jgi:DNA (cytosine-5)-methyltransferase 1